MTPTPAPDRFAVAAALREIALLLEVKGGNPYRARAYQRGGAAVEALAGMAAVDKLKKGSDAQDGAVTNPDRIVSMQVAADAK